MRSELNRTIRTFLESASREAAGRQAMVVGDLKADSTYVTDVDIALSEYAQDLFSPVTGSDAVVTEEHQGILDAIRSGHRAEDDEILVVVDPIDGTRNYVHGLPLYAVSVGVLKNRKPWLGGLAFPGFGYAIVFDGEAVLRFPLSHPSSIPETVARPDTALNRQSLVFTSDGILSRHTWDTSICRIMMIGSSVVESAWTALGHGVASIFGAHIWDIAGVWPVFEHFGLFLHRLSDGSAIRTYDVADYSPRNDCLTERGVICRPEDFPTLKRALVEVVANARDR
ncbi:MAG: inositol monophosphatase family protein [Spirochaetaceae bacterium]